jgi:hypothetical protein
VAKIPPVWQVATPSLMGVKCPMQRNHSEDHPLFFTSHFLPPLLVTMDDIQLFSSVTQRQRLEFRVAVSTTVSDALPTMRSLFPSTRNTTQNTARGTSRSAGTVWYPVVRLFSSFLFTISQPNRPSLLSACTVMLFYRTCST